MAHLNKKCMACQTRYSYCPDCSRADKIKPSYFDQFCSESCKDLWLTLTRYNMGRLTKSEAKSIISKLELKPIDTYVDCVKRDYANVMTEEKKSRRNKRIEVQPVIQPIVEEIKIEPQIIVEKASEDTTIYEVVIKENE